jgi:hypothetical protein
VGEGTWILSDTFEVLLKWTPQVNQNGYSIRLYAKFTDDDRARDKEYLYQFCSYIAEELNKQLQSNQRVVVRRESFIEGLKEVWSDMIGDKIQLLHLMRGQLHDNVDTDFGRNNLPICYTYWQHGDFHWRQHKR